MHQKKLNETNMTPEHKKAMLQYMKHLMVDVNAGLNVDNQIERVKILLTNLVKLKKHYDK